MKRDFNPETGITTWQLTAWWQKTLYWIGIISFWFFTSCFTIGFITGLVKSIMGY